MMNVILDDIFEVFVLILKLRKQEDNLDYQNVGNALIESQKIKRSIQYNIKTMEKLVNRYFERTHFWDKLTVKYDDEWQHFMIKQPMIHKIKRNDVRYIALEKCFNDYKRVEKEGLGNARHLRVRYSVSLNLIDLPL